jgi:ferrous iron transport protein B
MLYIPCISVILVLASEFGWKRALAISALEVVLAIAVGGIVFRALSLWM